jgi:hypothetical protein
LNIDLTTDLNVFLTLALIGASTSKFECNDLC